MLEPAAFANSYLNTGSERHIRWQSLLEVAAFANSYPGTGSERHIRSQSMLEVEPFGMAGPERALAPALTRSAHDNIFAISREKSSASH